MLSPNPDRRRPTDLEMADARNLGHEAGNRGAPASVCPYRPNTDLSRTWHQGRRDAMESALEASGPTIRRTLLAALATHKGDDLRKAEHAFQGLSSAKMAEEYGQSGETRQAILDSFKAHEQAVADARRWVELQLGPDTMNQEMNR